MMKTYWTRGRVISAVIALGLFGIAATSFLGARNLYREFEQWQSAKPVDAFVDLSKPGVSILPFHQTCSSSHSEVIGLSLPGSGMDYAAVVNALRLAQMKLEILGGENEEVIARSELDTSWIQRESDGPIPIFHLPQFRKGEFTARLTVTREATALKGHQQKLEGYYLLCGLEAMPAAIMNMIGIGASVIGAIVSFILVPRVLHKPRRQKASPDDSHQDQANKNKTESDP